MHSVCLKLPYKTHDRCCRKHSLRQLRRESPKYSNMFECETCDRNFSSDEALQQHLRDSRAHAVTLECETCDRTFNSDEALQQHLRDLPAHIYEITQSMHLYLHDDVSRVLVADGLLFEFHQANVFENCIKSYDTNITGRFVCSNRACEVKRWSSKKIAIPIRLYRDERYNAVVWHQRCRNCKSLGQPILDSTYA